MLNLSEIHNKRFYWKIRSAWLSKRNSLASSIFRGIKYSSQEKSNITNLSTLGMSALWSSFYALASFLIIWAIDDKLDTVTWISIFPKINSSAYSEIFSSIAAAGTVFIGLYYAGISTVASVAYAQVPSNLRNLLVKDALSNAFMSALAYVTVSATIFLCGQALGVLESRIAVVLLGILSIICVYSFVRLGQRVFSFFDQTKWSITLAAEMNEIWKQLNRTSKYESLQNLHRELRFDSLSIVVCFEFLFEMTTKDRSLKNGDLSELSRRILTLLEHHQYWKRRFPTNSEWYGFILKHPEWYRSNDLSLNVPAQTQTLLQPQKIADSFWFENRLEELPLQCFQLNCAGLHFENAYSLIEPFRTYIDMLIVEGNVDRALILIDNLWNSFKVVLTKEIAEEKMLLCIAITEGITSLDVSILLGVANRAKQVQRKDHLQRISNASLTKANTIYSGVFTRSHVSVLEGLLPKLQFEEEINGDIITAPWYIVELLALNDADIMTAATQKVVTL